MRSLPIKRIALHVSFWLVLCLLLAWLEVRINQLPFGFALGNEALRVGFYILLVYFNLYVLIPRFLSERKLILYGALMVLSVLLITPVMVTVFYWKFQDYPELQAQVSRYQVGYYLLNFLITAAFALFKIVSDWVKGERDRRKIQTETMQSELRFLKSQINPHFLFNTLNSLYALTIKKSDLAPEIVLRLSDMMRYMLYECNERTVPLTREIAYIENYLQLEKLRHGERADVQFNLEGHVAGQQIAPLMFIPFLENSFKHGLARTVEKGYVHARMMVAAQEIYFEITNSKPEQQQQPEGRRYGGIGLTNVKKRLDLLYASRYDLSVENDPLFFRVGLRLELPHDS